MNLYLAFPFRCNVPLQVNKITLTKSRKAAIFLL